MSKRPNPVSPVQAKTPHRNDEASSRCVLGMVDVSGKSIAVNYEAVLRIDGEPIVWNRT